FRAVAADVVRDLAAAGRVADVDRVLQVEGLDERREVVGVRVHVVTAPRLARAAVAATVVRDAAVTARREEDHLVLPCVGRERPAVAEDDGLPRSPVLVIELDGPATDGHPAHDSPFRGSHATLPSRRRRAARRRGARAKRCRARDPNRERAWPDVGATTVPPNRAVRGRYGVTSRRAFGTRADGSAPRALVPDLLEDRPGHAAGRREDGSLVVHRPEER